MFARVDKGLVLIALTALSVFAAQAKEAPLTAIELFDTSKGAAYLQITDVLVNGKAELRGCTGTAQKIDKSAYGKLPKVGIAGATSLARSADGVMLLTRDAATTCVVPANLKFEKDESLTPAELAERAGVTARVLSSSSNAGDALPVFKPGVELRFVPAPDVELAEYLRAERARSIAGWQDYLGRYPNAAHTVQARQASATLLVKQGEDSLAAYRKSTSTSTAPSFTDLKSAKTSADQALALSPNFASASKLREAVGIELGTVTEKARGELQAYKQALTSHGPGYAHLTSARKLIGQIFDVDPKFDAAQSLQTNVNNESRTLESSLTNAETLQASQRFDDALTAIAAYRSFADEEPRVAAIVNAAYKYHFDQGTAFVGSQKWQEAASEFQKAVGVSKTPEAVAGLKKAEDQVQVSQARQAADAALAQCEALAGQHQYIDAYEALATLPKASRALVADRMQALEPDYIKEASDKAKTLQTAHTPIRGSADEVGVLRAYDLLQSAFNLSEDNKNLKLRLDLVSQSLSDYYLQEARRYLQKPLGSGVGMGSMYLDQSQLFQPNREDVRDERTKSSAVYQMRSKLSIRVVFRDQTSRRDSAGFADQMSDAIATGVETSSGLPVKVVRASDNPSVDPNFQLVGDVLQHRPVLNPTIEPMESKYRFGAREIPNEEWNKANREYETATLELQRAQHVLEGAQSHGKKKEIADATTSAEDAEKKVQDAHRKLDSLPKTNPDDIIKPYTYTKRTIDLAAVVEVSFRILDTGGDTVEPPTRISKTNHKTFVVLENVKPEDTEGVKAQGSPPDEIQFLSDVEIDARDALIKAVVEKVQGLPAKILALARKHVQEGDMDGASEKYILYLNSTPEGQTAERAEAQKFLQEQFHIRQLATPAS